MKNNDVLKGNYYYFQECEDAMKNLKGDYTQASFDVKLRDALKNNPELRRKVEEHCIKCEMEIRRQGNRMGHRLFWLEELI